MHRHWLWQWYLFRCRSLLIANGQMLQFNRPSGESNVTLAALLESLPGAAEFAQEDSRDGFYTGVRFEIVLDHHVFVVLEMVTKIFAAAEVVLLVRYALVGVKVLLGCVQRKTDTALEGFRIRVTRPVHVQFLLAVEGLHAHVADEGALNVMNSFDVVTQGDFLVVRFVAVFARVSNGQVNARSVVSQCI